MRPNLLVKIIKKMKNYDNSRFPNYFLSNIMHLTSSIKLWNDGIHQSILFLRHILDILKLQKKSLE